MADFEAASERMISAEIFRRTRRDEATDGGVLIGTSTEGTEEQQSYTEN